MNIKKPITKGIAKVPVIMQLEALECGAASLAMVLAYYDKWIPLEKVRSDCGVSRDGSNAKNCMAAARSYGLIAKGFRYEPEMLKEEGQFPCIIHWNFNHFVVLDGFKGDYAYLNDPGRGEVKVTMKEFDESFTGVCLMFEPGENFTPSGKPKSVLEFAKERMKGKGMKTAIVFAFLVSVITALLGIIDPAFSRIFIDRLLTHQNDNWLTPFIVAMSVFTFVKIVIQWIQIVYNNRINKQLDAVGSSSFMWKIMKLPIEFFSQRLAGDIQSRQSSNSMIANTLVNTFAPLFLNSVMAIFYLVVMIRYNITLTIIGLSSMLINVFVTNYIAKKRVNISRVSQRDGAKLYSTTIAGIEMIESIKASGSEDGYFERWAGYQASVNDGTIKFEKINNYIGIIPGIISSITSLLITGYGIYLTFTNEFTIGMIMAFSGYLTSFMAPASTFLNASSTIQEMRTEMERIDDVMKYPDDPAISYDNLDENETYDKLSGNIEMKNVTFGYSKLANPLITDFNLSIKPGQRVAIKQFQK